MFVGYLHTRPEMIVGAPPQVQTTWQPPGGLRIQAILTICTGILSIALKLYLRCPRVSG